MFMLFLGVLALIGLVSLLSGALGTAAAGFGALILLPILLFKLFIILMIFDFLGRRMRYRGRGPWTWGSPRRERPTEPAQPDEDRFDEWHRMSHARREVASWTDGMPDFEQE